MVTTVASMNAIAEAMMVATNKKGRFCSGQPVSDLKAEGSPSLRTEGPVEGAAGAGLGVDRFGHGDRMDPSRLEFVRIQIR